MIILDLITLTFFWYIVNDIKEIPHIFNFYLRIFKLYLHFWNPHQVWFKHFTKEISFEMLNRFYLKMSE